MAKVICTLPNASGSINGVKFVSHKDGMISEEIDDEVALHFLSINGYVEPKAASKPDGKPDPKADPNAKG